MKSNDADEQRPARKRGRPARRERADEILNAGFLEFAEKGFDATRLDKVAERAGVAKGTLYLYYDSKEALFEAAVRSRISPILGHVTRIIDLYPGPTRFLLRQMLRVMYRQIAKGDVRTIIRIIIAEGDRFPALAEFYHREFVSKMMTILRSIIRKGIERGELRDSAATQLPMVLIAPGIMAAIWQMSFNRYEPIALDRFLESHIDLVMNGITSRGASDDDRA